jgi:hypothetical protein
VALVAGLLVPGWCLLSVLNLKHLSPVLALPAAAGIGIAIVSVAAWLGWATGTGMIGAAVLTGLASVGAVAARVVWRARSSPLPRPDPGDRLFEIGAAALAFFAAGISVVNGPWLGQSADSFYHMAAALRLIQENKAIPQDVFFGTTMQYPDATSGTIHVALAWLSMLAGIVPAWKALAIFGSALLALAFANFAREVTRSASAALIAAYLYFLIELYFDMRDMAYPDRLGQALGWLSMVFFLRFARSEWVRDKGPFPWREHWPDLVPMCLLGFASGSVYPGMTPLIVILVLATFGFAVLSALHRRDFRSITPLAIACAAMLIVVLPVLAIRLLAALPQPGLDATLATYSPRLRVIVFHGYPFVDPRFWFGGTLITITTVGTLCLVDRARRWLLHGDPGAALLWGALLFVPAVCATPFLVNSSNGLYALARIAFLLSPILYVPLGWELSRLLSLAGYIRTRNLKLATWAPVVAGLLLVAATTNVVAQRLVTGTIPIYFGHGSRSLSATHKLDVSRNWADRLKALDAAGPGVILAGLETSYELAGLTGRTIVSVPRGHTPYQDEARDGALRRGDVSDAMKPSVDPADLISVLVRYHVTFVMSDQASDGQASWEWIASQKELTPVAAGKDWKLYRFDPRGIDEALSIPLTIGTAIFPSRVIAGRAVFVRVTSLGQGGQAHVTAEGVDSGANYDTQFAFPDQAGATVTVPLLLPDSAPVDRYSITITGDNFQPILAGQFEVGHAYEAEYFAGAFQNYRRGFARNAGWEVLTNTIYNRDQASAALLVGSVASHPLAEAPGNYCLSVLVYDAGDGRVHSISVGLGGNAFGTTWSGGVKGIRELDMAASVGTASHEVTYWVPAGSRSGAVIDRITLYPARPDGTCEPGP